MHSALRTPPDYATLMNIDGVMRITLVWDSGLAFEEATKWDRGRRGVAEEPANDCQQLLVFLRPLQVCRSP